MEYVEIQGRDGRKRKFSRLIMGTDHLKSSNWVGPGQTHMPDEEIKELLDEAVSLGINVFDSSKIYEGFIQSLLGPWLNERKNSLRSGSFTIKAELNPDNDLYSISKGGFPFDLYNSQALSTDEHSWQLMDRLRAEQVLDQGEDSVDGQLPLSRVPIGTYGSLLFGNKEQIIRRLQDEIYYSREHFWPDIITVYLMHRDDNDYFDFKHIQRKQIPVETILEALSSDDLSKKYTMIGLSNWKTERVDDAVMLASNNDELLGPLLNSPYFSLFEMSDSSIHAGGIQVTHEEMMNPSFQNGIKLMPYSPLGGYSILDKPGEAKWKAAKDVALLEGEKSYYKNVYKAIFTEENEKRYRGVVAFTQMFNNENKTSYTADQMINAYALAHERADFLTIGPITIEQLRRTVASLELSEMLTPKILDDLHKGVYADSNTEI